MNFAQLRQSQKGQAVVEMSLIFMVFALLFFAVVEYSHLFYTKLTLRNALGEAGRYAATGQADIEDPQNPGSNLARPDAIRAVFDRFMLGVVHADLQEFTINPADGGEPGETVTVTARFNKPLFTGLIGQFFPGVGSCPAGQVCFNVSTTWTNEPFLPGAAGGGE